MFIAWVIFHVIISIGLVLVVLLQSSKGEGLAGTALGGGGGGLSGAVFGGRGAGSFLSKATTVLAILFMFNCIGLAFLSANSRTTTSTSSTGEESVVTKMAQEERDRYLQQQQQQQQQAADSAGGLEITPIENAPKTTPGDSQ